MYKYWGYSMNILSELPLPELVPNEFETDPDLVIRIGETPGSLSGNDVIEKVNAWIGPGQYLLSVDGIATYHSTNGNQVTVSPAPGAHTESLRLFLLSNALTAILYQRDLLPIHASAVLNNGELTLFAGASGAGKSTIAALMGQEGYQVFSDDVCIIDPTPVDGRIIASACYPAIKLWEESIGKLGLGKDSSVKIRPHLEKYAFRFHKQFVKDKYPVKRIFLLEVSSMITEVKVEKIGSQITVFAELQKHAYRKLQMNAMKKRPLLFAALSKLAGQCEVIKITRPKKEDSLAQIRETIIPYLEKKVDDTAHQTSPDFLQKQSNT